MVQEQVTEGEAQHPEHREPVAVTVNNKSVTLPSHRVTGLEVKEAAVAQGVQVELDFLLTEEAHDGHAARTIEDDETITVAKHSAFTANDNDDDS